MQRVTYSRRKYQADWLRKWRKKNPELAKSKDFIRNIRDKHKRAIYSRNYYKKIKDTEKYISRPINQIGRIGQSLELDVILSKDAEGNGFSPLADLGLFHYEPDSTWSGEIHPCKKGSEDCVVFDPIN